VKYISAWIALGVTGVTITGGCLAACMTIPFIGWFIGAPIVLACAFMAGCVWGAVFLCLLPLMVAKK